MKTVYLSLGSNVGDRKRMLESAISLLDGPHFRIRRVSTVYETEPVGLRRQGWFLNLVLEAETDLFPRQLLSRIQRVELELGRRRLKQKGPRTIDIDILLYGDSVIRSSELVIPHPRLEERRFVLAPLAELSPELRHPISGHMLAELLPATLGQALRKVEFRPVIPRR